MKRGPKIICLRRKVLAAVGCLAAAILMCWTAASPNGGSRLHPAAAAHLLRAEGLQGGVYQLRCCMG